MIENREKVLVTGAKGMLGWALTKELSPSYQVIGIDIEDADITDENQIREEIFSIHPDIVIHAAAYTEVDYSEKNKELAHKVNATGAANVAKACKLCSAKLLYISTDFVFDGEKNSPYTEEDTANPINAYGWSKLEGEKHVLEILQNCVITRTAWLFGPHGENFVDKMIQISKRGTALKVVNDQTGSPTYTIDLAKAIALLLRVKGHTGIVNISNSGACTWYEFAKTIFSLSGIQQEVIPISSSELARPAKRPRYSVLDTARFTKLTGAKLRPWQKTLEEYLSSIS